MGKLVTAWSRWDKKEEEFKHNHIEYGHSELDGPEPKSEQQKKSWTNAKWEKELCKMDENTHTLPLKFVEWMKEMKKERVEGEKWIENSK